MLSTPSSTSLAKTATLTASRILAAVSSNTPQNRGGDSFLTNHRKEANNETLSLAPAQAIGRVNFHGVDMLPDALAVVVAPGALLVSGANNFTIWSAVSKTVSLREPTRPQYPGREFSQQCGLARTSAGSLDHLNFKLCPVAVETSLKTERMGASSAAGQFNLGAWRNKTLHIGKVTPDSKECGSCLKHGNQARLKVSFVRWVMDRFPCRVKFSAVPTLSTYDQNKKSTKQPYWNKAATSRLLITSGNALPGNRKATSFGTANEGKPSCKQPIARTCEGEALTTLGSGVESGHATGEMTCAPVAGRDAYRTSDRPVKYRRLSRSSDRPAHPSISRRPLERENLTLSTADFSPVLTACADSDASRKCAGYTPAGEDNFGEHSEQGSTAATEGEAQPHTEDSRENLANRHPKSAERVFAYSLSRKETNER